MTTTLQSRGLNDYNNIKPLLRTKTLLDRDNSVQVVCFQLTETPFTLDCYSTIFVSNR